MTEPNVTAPAAGPAESTSRWEDFIDIFYAPADVFRRRAASGFAIPLFAVAIAMAILAFTNSGVLQPVMDAEFTRVGAAMARQGTKVPPEMLEGMRKWGELTARYLTGILMIVTMFIVGIMTWLVSKLVDSRQTFNASMIVVCYAYMVRVVEQIIYGVEGLLMDADKLTSHFALQLGPARFFDPDTTSPVMMAILGRFDVITLWETALLAIGVYAVGRVSRNRAIVAGVLFWLVGAAFVLLSALRQPS